MTSTGFGLAVALFAGVTGLASAPAAQDIATARRLFLEIESAARLPFPQQGRRLPRLYRDVCPDLRAPYAAHTLFTTPVAPTRDESPANAADRLERAGGWPLLGEAGRRRCTEVLNAHRSAVEKLSRQDLRGASVQNQRWALHLVEQLHSVRLFDEVVVALGANDPDPIYAAQALRALDDPRAIPILIRRFADEPTRFYETLRSLQRNRAPHPLLLELLQSRDAQVRWQATYALVESRDAVLLPLVRTLVADAAADVRRQAGYLAVNFDAAAYRVVRPSLVPLFSDPDVGVRADVAVAVASLKDVAIAPVLLGLIEIEDKLEPWRQSNVAQAIQTLTGSYFGLVPGTASSPAARAKALAAFAQWIKDHPPDMR